MPRIPHCRWWVITLVFLAAVLNYVDRQVPSALAPTLQKDLGMTDRDYANIVNIFLVASTLAYLVADSAWWNKNPDDYRRFPVASLAKGPREPSEFVNRVEADQRPKPAAPLPKTLP